MSARVCLVQIRLAAVSPQPARPRKLFDSPQSKRRPVGPRGSMLNLHFPRTEPGRVLRRCREMNLHESSG
jgi:hypothetical protein